MLSLGTGPCRDLVEYVPYTILQRWVKGLPVIG